MIQLSLVPEYQHSTWLLIWAFSLILALAAVLAVVKVLDEKLSEDRLEAFTRGSLTVPFVVYLLIPWSVVFAWGWMSDIEVLYMVYTGFGVWNLGTYISVLQLLLMLALFMPLAVGLIQIHVSYPDHVQSYFYGAVAYWVLVGVYYGYAYSAVLSYLPDFLPGGFTGLERLSFLVLFAGFLGYFVSYARREGGRALVGYTLLMYSSLLVIGLAMVSDMVVQLTS